MSLSKSLQDYKGSPVGQLQTTAQESLARKESLPMTEIISCNFCLASSSTSGFGTMFLLQLPITEDPRHPSGASTLRTQDLNLEGCSALVFCRVTKCRDIVSLLTLLPQCGIFTPKLMFLGELQKIFVFHKPSVS